MTCFCGNQMTKEIKPNLVRYFCTNCGGYEVVKINEVQKK